jgi:hypothetical protein
MWACEKIDDGAFVGSVGIFEPLDWPEPGIAYSLDQESGSHMTRWWRKADSNSRSRSREKAYRVLAASNHSSAKARK